MTKTILRIQCFKAIGSKTVELELGDLTLLFGPNASGKSSIIEALYHLLRAPLAGEETRRLSEYVNTSCRDLRIELETGAGKLVLTTSGCKLVAPGLLDENQVIECAKKTLASILPRLAPEFTGKLLEDENVRHEAREIAKSIAEEGFEVGGITTYTARSPANYDYSCKLTSVVKKVYNIELTMKSSSLVRVILQKMIQSFPQLGEVQDVIKLLAELRFSSELSECLLDAIVGITERKLVGTLSWFYPVLWVPAWRDLKTAEMDTKLLGVAPPPVRTVTTESLLRELSWARLRLGSRKYEEMIGQQAHHYEVSPVSTPYPDLTEEGSLVLYAGMEGLRYPESMAADGERSLHVLFYALGVMAEGKGLLLLEEPELHLHPKLHWRIAKAVVDTVKRGARVMVSTHSDHFIVALAALVEKGVLGKERVKAYYVHRCREGVCVEEVELTRRGLLEKSHLLEEFVEGDIRALLGELS